MIHDKITSRLKDEKSKYRSLSFLLRAKILVWAIFYAQGVTMIAFLIDPKLPKNVPLNFVFLIMFYVSAIAASSEYKSKSEEKEDKPNTEKSKE